MWGELLEELEGIRAERTIPTRVGRTDPKAIDHHGMADHPHACGENHFIPQNGVRLCGPSPRVWGEQILKALRASLLRTIPTRVGRTGALLAGAFSLTDHPHACGENPTSANSRA